MRCLHTKTTFSIKNTKRSQYKNTLLMYMFIYPNIVIFANIVYLSQRKSIFGSVTELSCAPRKLYETKSTISIGKCTLSSIFMMLGRIRIYTKRYRHLPPFWSGRKKYIKMNILKYKCKLLLIFKIERHLFT